MPSATLNFSACSPAEQVSRAMDFSPALAAGESLTGTPVCSVSVLSGSDPTPSNRLVGGPTISGTQVGVLLGTMIAGCVYQITMTVLTTKNQTLVLYASQPVLSR